MEPTTASTPPPIVIPVIGPKRKQHSPPVISVVRKCDSALDNRVKHTIPLNVELTTQCKVDLHGISKLMESRSSSSPTIIERRIENSTATAAVTPSDTDDVKVDSALLSALRDPREKMALLRLEQTLIDFMNDRTSGFMEVGGALNSIVVRGASGGGVYSCVEADSSLSQPVGETCVSAVSPNVTAAANHPVTEGSQSSFQRLCLHRLADRFNIARESPSAASGQQPPQSAEGKGARGRNSSNYDFGLIRLVKVKNSRIPSSLLIDLDPLVYMNNPERLGRGGGQPRGGTVSSPENYGIDAVSDRLASSGLKEGKSSEKKLSRKKIMIMKRNSSKLGSSDNLIGCEGGNGSPGQYDKLCTMKSKKLSDKEKLYAEARARIFQTDSATVQEAEEDGSAPGCTGTPSEDASQGSSAADVPTMSSPSSYEIEDPNYTKACYANEANLSNPPAASTGGAIRKVTWRNRRQEESDPDFRRGHAPVQMQSYPGFVVAPIHSPAQGVSQNFMPMGGVSVNGLSGYMDSGYNIASHQPFPLSNAKGVMMNGYFYQVQQQQPQPPYHINYAQQWPSQEQFFSSPSTRFQGHQDQQYQSYSQSQAGGNASFAPFSHNVQHQEHTHAQQQMPQRASIPFVQSAPSLSSTSFQQHRFETDISGHDASQFATKVDKFSFGRSESVNVSASQQIGETNNST